MAPRVLLIGKNGEKIGVVDIREAMWRARKEGLDLVEVAPNANPPVCRIMDYGKFLYEEQKKQREAKKKQTTLKEITMKPNIDEHDYQVKLKHIREFLEDNHRVRVVIRMRGREMIHPERAEELAKRVVEETKDLARVDGKMKKEDWGYQFILIPLKKGR